MQKIRQRSLADEFNMRRKGLHESRLAQRGEALIATCSNRRRRWTVLRPLGLISGAQFVTRPRRLDLHQFDPCFQAIRELSRRRG